MRNRNTTLVAAAILAWTAGCGSDEVARDLLPSDAQTTAETAARTDVSESSMTDQSSDVGADSPASTELATFGAGCFWCVEAVLEQFDGVTDVTSGYMGGHVDNPTYKAICSGDTGHAEVIQATFDPSVISYEQLVDLFWQLHDPTTLNRQGNDVGTQYRSAIFYHSDDQKRVAEASLAQAQPKFKDKIVTEITPASTYYKAEDYHQDYYRANKSQPYCRAIIAPKLKKLGLEQ